MLGKISICEAKACTCCGGHSFSQVRFVACAAETRFRVIGPTDPMGKWYHVHEDLKFWKFPLCDKCLRTGLISHVVSLIKLFTKAFYPSLGLLIISLFLAVFYVDPKPHPWSSREGMIAIFLLLAICATIFTAVVILKQRVRLKALRSGIDISPDDYDSAFSGEAEDIMKIRKGKTAPVTFPVPTFRDSSLEPPENATDLSKELKVVAVGITLSETIERLPKEWKEFLKSTQ